MATAAVPWLGIAGAATDEDLAFAHFGVSAEFLLGDFYSKTLDKAAVTALDRQSLSRGRMAARRHAMALSDLLAGAGETAPTAEDFAFAWPRNTFSQRAKTLTTGLTILRAVQGTYQTAAATASDASYRVLFTSLAASAGQQIGALRVIAGRAGADSFPLALDLETASAAIESYLG